MERNESRHERGERRRGHDHGEGRGGREGRREGRRGGGRRRRGDIRALLLAGLLQGPAHGYELIARLEERSGGQWRPSAGSVYPTLQLLGDEGLVVSRDEDGRKVYDLTDEGRAQADEATFDRLEDDGDPATGELRTELHQLVLAYRQVERVADPAQHAEAAAMLRTARRGLYRLLAGEED